MAEIGWIKLHRKVLDCWIWQEKPYDKARAWVDLLLLAMHHDKKLLIENEVVIVPRGSFMTSIVKLANRWGWSRCKAMRYLELLESEQMLNTKRTPKGTLVTIVKYEDYQIGEVADDTTVDTTLDTSNDTTNDTPLDTTDDTTVDTQNKNIKNIKNDKNVKKNNNRVAKAPDAYYPNDEKLNQAFIDFMEMRKKIKKPMTDRAITLAMNKLKELSTLPFSDTMDNDLAIQILEQSTMNCWQSLYPINKSSGKQGNSIDWNNV